MIFSFVKIITIHTHINEKSTQNDIANSSKYFNALKQYIHCIPYVFIDSIIDYNYIDFIINIIISILSSIQILIAI